MAISRRISTLSRIFNGNYPKNSRMARVFVCILMNAGYFPREDSNPHKQIQNL